MKYTDPRPTAVCDTECYPNYWSIGFKNVKSGRTVVLEMFDGNPLDRARIAQIMRNYRVVTWNGMKYDLPMILLAMSPDTTNADLKHANDQIIVGGMTAWKFMEHYGLTVPDFIDHIDLIEVNPGGAQRPSLKLSGGRLHTRRMQDLPFEVSRELSMDDIDVVRGYHGNDLDMTIDHWNELQPQITLRAQMSEQYGIDLRSKSDAQVAEAVIKSEIEALTRRRLYKPTLEPHSFRYIAPSYVAFQTAPMQQLLADVISSDFRVDPNGSDNDNDTPDTGEGAKKKSRLVDIPRHLLDRDIVIGSTTYKMGIGGLHSTESSVCHVADEQYVLIDRDVESFYPRIILNNRLTPKHIGDNFLKVYESIVNRRIAAKKSGDKTTAESLKVTINGSFGKLGSKYSTLCSPNLMIQVTVTGQLSILMLIESMELNGIQVISANTDGFVSKVPRDKIDLFNAIVFDWECDTSFVTEETRYLALYSRDVNSYLAVKSKFDKSSKQWLDEIDGIKTKGAFADSGPGLPAASGLKKTPTAQICPDAVTAYLTKGTSIEETVGQCQDVRKFVVVRRVVGGAADQDGELVGKAVRWYYSTEVTGPLRGVKKGNVVSRSDGARPLMELPDDYAVPADLNRDWYVREAYGILQDVGFGAIDPSLIGRSGTFFGMKVGQKSIHTVDAKTGIALCGAARASVREKWQEFASVPVGHRYCSKCRKEGEL